MGDASRFVQLDRRYDVDALARDVSRLAHVERHSPGPYATAGWDGLSLLQADGRADDTRSPLPSVGGPRPTPLFERCPYLAELIAELPAPVLVARLLYLAPGGHGALHRDAIGLAVGAVRLHVPIATNPDAVLWLAGETARWAPGELWFGDFLYPHRIANDGATTRVHLALDVCVTDALLALFPAERRAALCAAGDVYITPPSARLDEPALARFCGRVDFGRPWITGVAAAALTVRLERGELVASDDAGAKVLALDPIDERSARLRGYLPGVTVELSNGADAVQLVHRGRVTLPAGLSPDDDRTPFSLTTSRWTAAKSAAPR